MDLVNDHVRRIAVHAASNIVSVSGGGGVAASPRR